MTKGTDRNADDDTEKKYGNEKPISLHPLKPEQALRRAMSVPPPPRAKRAPPKKDR